MEEAFQEVPAEILGDVAPLKRVELFAKRGGYWWAKLYWDGFPARCTKSFRGRAAIVAMVEKERELEASRIRRGSRSVP